MKIVADMLLIITSTGDKLFSFLQVSRSVTLNDPEPPK